MYPLITLSINNHTRNDVIDALKQYGIIEQDRPELANYTKEEGIALKNILLSKFEFVEVI